MSGRQPQQQNHGDSISRPSSSRHESSRSATALPSVETLTTIEQDPHSATSSIRSTAQSHFRIPQSPRSAIGESNSKAAKVAIPRLKRNIDVATESATRSGGRHRVTHACEPCRHRKTKCSGERPVCRHCQDFKIVCFYADGKRDRVKKQFGSMAEKVADYEELLKDLTLRVSENDVKLIKASLDKAAQSEFDDVLTETGTIASVEGDVETELSTGGAESEASGGAGSTGALDRTDEDFTREGARATGFIGKNSEVTWMQRIRQENKFGDPLPQNADEKTRRIHRIANANSYPLVSKQHEGEVITPLAEAADGFAIQDSSYHLDDLDIFTSDTVDPYDLPTQDHAQLLFSTFMQRVQPTIPMVGQVNLSTQFYRFIANPSQRPPDKWLAVVNMIFAISAKYSHLIQAEWRGDERDHAVFFSRARMLAVGYDAFFKHPDLQTIQVFGLMSFYLMCIGQINRAWTLCGTAIRHAVALGLNMRNESSQLQDPLKEIRYRLWWALYYLDHRLSSITGRINFILEDYYTTPLPIPIDEDKFETEKGRKFLSNESQQGARAPSTNSHSPSIGRSVNSASSEERDRPSAKSEQSRSPSAVNVPNTDLDWAKDVQPSSSLYFLQMVQLTRLAQNVCHHIYSPASMERSWSFMQTQIRQLNEQLDTWYRKLPAVLDFQRKQRDREFYEFRLNLGFFYYATKEMIYRPCLCRLDRKLPGQSSKSREFNRNSAMSCVEAAQDMLRLIPDEPNAVGLLRVGPWWTILPYLVQTASVLMLEISFRAHHMPEEADSILESSKKAIRWLHALGEENLSAKRAWRLCNTMLHEAAARIGRDVRDLPEFPPAAESAEASGDGENMSGTSAVHNMSDQYHPSNINTSLYSGMSFPGYAAFAGYDQLMQYDQYFPMSDSMNGQMSGLSTHHYANVEPSEAELEFMTTAYHENRGDPPLSNNSRGTGMHQGRSGYMS